MVRRKEKPKEMAQEMIIKDEFGTELATYSPELVQTIKDTVAKGASDSELYMFLQVASMYGLNPFMKEIWFTKMGDENTIMTSRDGYAKIAKQNPNFKKCQSVAVYENDVFEVEMDMGDIIGITHKFKHTDRGKLVGAYAVLQTYLKGDELFAYSELREYDQRNRVWKKYPSAMIRKVAENDVYKRFAGINGLATVEEMPAKHIEEAIEESYIDVNQIKEE